MLSLFPIGSVRFWPKVDIRELAFNVQLTQNETFGAMGANVRFQPNVAFRIGIILGVEFDDFRRIDA